jgi:hypothetical protein
MTKMRTFTALCSSIGIVGLLSDCNPPGAVDQTRAENIYPSLVQAGNSPVIDGRISLGEWDQAGGESFADGSRFAVGYLKSTPPFEKIPWLAELKDDSILPTPGGLPPDLHFSPELWKGMNGN